MYNSHFKIEFAKHFNSDLESNPKLRILLYNIFVLGSAYIVGGYLRDFIHSKKSRDIDIIVDIETDKLVELIKHQNLKHTINRYNGIKLLLNNLSIDMWSIKNNWAFKNSLVKLNENNKLHSIAQGCFYNYDSLVINLHTLNYNIKNYKHFVQKNKLDILQKVSIYKNLNPTTEANILRAFYLKKVYNVQFTSNTKSYLIHKIGQIIDRGLNPIAQLILTKAKYEKYNAALSRSDIELMIKQLYFGNKANIQYYFEF